MDKNINERIMSLFENIDDKLNNGIDRIELTPVQITKNCYITGFRRAQSSYQDIDVHIKEIRKVKLGGINSSITDDGGWYMMEPDGEIWVNSTMISNMALDIALEHFTKKMEELKSIHLMLSKWKDENDNFPKVEVALFESKRVACKEALALRKKHKNVSTKFEMYNDKGELISFNGETTKNEPSDFELVTCKVE